MYISTAIISRGITVGLTGRKDVNMNSNQRRTNIDKAGNNFATNAALKLLSHNAEIRSASIFVYM